MESLEGLQGRIHGERIVDIESMEKGGNWMKITKHLKRQSSHWALVVFNTLALIVGQAAATLLSRYYFDEGGDSRWLSTLLQVVGWPILLLPLFLNTRSGSSQITPLTLKVGLVYLVLGVIVCGDNLLYSWGVSFMPASTYSLLCSSQLAFNVVFSYFIAKQKLTFYIINSVVLLTFGAILLGIYSNGDRPEGVTDTQYIVGFFCTVGASALYGLLLPLMQLAFKKVLKKETFTVVLEMQIYTSFVATLVCIVGLFASGESKELRKEADGFGDGKVAYWMTLVWSAIGWQVCSVGVVGLIFQVSSLFSNVVSTLALPVVPILSVGFFHDKINAVKVISMLLCIWGFVSYVYGGYADSKYSLARQNSETEEQDGSVSVSTSSRNR